MRKFAILVAAFAALFYSCDPSANQTGNGGNSADRLLETDGLSHAFPTIPPSEDEAAQEGGDAIFTHSNFKGKTYRHKNYSLSYSEEDEQAEWVAYELTREEVNGKLERKEGFDEDPAITTKSASPSDYQNSGYDRGHLAPAADMKFDETAMEECFYMSNVSPQVKEFNNGVWNDLEMQTRAWTRKYGTIYVVTGPVLPKDSKNARKMYASERGKDYKTNVTVPSHFYKILFDFTKKGKEKMLAFVIPNQDTHMPFTTFVTSVDEVEKVTGIDFFTNLDEEVERRCESRSDLTKWPEATYINYSSTHTFNH